MANTKKAGSSTGKRSTKTQTLAKEKGSVEKPSAPVQTKNADASGLKTLADILSLVQEDVRSYNEALAKLGQDSGAGLVAASAGMLIALGNPEGHILGVKDGHITLDGAPVTGWTLAKTDTGK